MSQLLASQVGMHPLVVRIEFVDGVQPLGPVARVPGAPEHLRGITTCLGYLLPILDLQVLLGLPDAIEDAPIAGPAWFVVLRHASIRVAVTTPQLPNLLPLSGIGADSPEHLDVPSLLAAAMAHGGEFLSTGTSA
jgi:chemotaxis signal transduction protein